MKNRETVQEQHQRLAERCNQLLVMGFGVSIGASIHGYIETLRESNNKPITESLLFWIIPAVISAIKNYHLLHARKGDEHLDPKEQ